MYIQKHLAKKEVSHQINQANSYIQQQNRLQNEANLFMKGLRKDITEAEVKGKFSEVGEVLSVSLNLHEFKDEMGIVTGSKMTGYVKMSNQLEAQKAIQKFEGEFFFGPRFTLDFWQDKRQLKQERVAKEQNNFQQMASHLMNIIQNPQQQNRVYG
jgi:RNA recognition motif-containing protein